MKKTIVLKKTKEICSTTWKNSAHGVELCPEGVANIFRVLRKNTNKIKVTISDKPMKDAKEIHMLLCPNGVRWGVNAHCRGVFCHSARLANMEFLLPFFPENQPKIKVWVKIVKAG